MAEPQIFGQTDWQDEWVTDCCQLQCQLLLAAIIKTWAIMKAKFAMRSKD